MDGKEKSNNQDYKNNPLLQLRELNKGDDVRIYIKNDMDPFGKLKPLWSKEIYKIESKRNGYYKLNNNELYRNNQLQKLNINNIMKKSNQIQNPPPKEIETLNFFINIIILITNWIVYIIY